MSKSYLTINLERILKKSLSLGIFVLCMSATSHVRVDLPEVCVSKEEYALYQLILKYRKENGLPSIPLSKSLTYVAQQHCRDLYLNKPDLAEECNAHSWSNKGKWTACCYTSDHKKSSCMWTKPKELTNYQDFGFEIAAGSSKPFYAKYDLSPTESLEMWKGSQGHNGVILNKKPWDSYAWKAIGIGMYKNFAVVWFGASSDDELTPTICVEKE